MAESRMAIEVPVTTKKSALDPAQEKVHKSLIRKKSRPRQTNQEKKLHAN